MKRSILLATISISLLFLFTLSVLAQEEKKEIPNVADFYMLKVKDGMEAKFESELKAHSTWRMENGDPWEWYVFQVLTGEYTGRYIIRSQNLFWEDYDNVGEFYANAVQHYMETVTPLIDSFQAAIHEVSLELSRLPKNLNEYPLLEVFAYYLKPDGPEGFFGALGKIHQAIVQTEWPAYYHFEMVRSGGFAPKVYLVIWHNNWADFKDPEKSMDEILVEVHGAEETAEIMKMFSESVHKMDSMVLVMRPDLSVLKKK